MKIETETTENLGRKQSIMKHGGKQTKNRMEIRVGISPTSETFPLSGEQVVKQPKHGHLQLSRRSIHYSHTHVAREEITK